ncbi:sensor histidine kinase [Ramlibacter sp. PS4R-6]|uniref:sensor histidine kinase n=1 Tax=Ramlibacter sp. PS4R-6 TaxID=3133438 RepID=UPI0030B6C384
MDAPQVAHTDPVVVAMASERTARPARDAADLERRRNVYLATVAHEIRNALAPLSCAIDVLAARARADDASADMLPIARRQVAQLAGLTEDLLDIGRAVTDEFRMEFKRHAVQDLVGGVVAAWSVLAQTKQQSITVEMPLPPLWVRADRLRLGQALQNVVGNAIKFTPEGGRILVRVFATQAHATICVTDSGIGIAEADLANIFQLFYRVRREGPGPGGFGIGLALARQFVECHGGMVNARSEGAGRGSTLTITLPLAGAPVAA